MRKNKKYIMAFYTIITLFFSLVLNAQNNQFIRIDYKYSFVMPASMNLQGPNFMTTTLIDNGQATLLTKYNRAAPNFYYDKIKDVAFYGSGIFSKSFTIKEDSLSQKFNWQLCDSTETILGYKCKAAKAYFRGRNYVGFYTDNINFNTAPWKFVGLPGVTLKVASLDSIYTYVAISLNIYNENKVIENPHLSKISEAINYITFYNLTRKSEKEREAKLNTDEKDGETEYKFKFTLMEIGDK